jgi:two-component system, OmpR family, osmolarity sensor histidine kinase EnvZ
MMKRFLPQTLFARSLWILLTPLFLTVALSTFIFFDRHWATTTQRLAESLAGEVGLVADLVAQAKNNPDALEKLSQQVQAKLALTISFDAKAQWQEPKRQIKTGLLRRVEDALAVALRQRVGPEFAIRRYTKNDDSLLIRLPVAGGVLAVAVDQKRVFSTTTYIFLLTMVLGAMVLTLIAAVFMRNQLRPMRKLAVAAERLGRGQPVPLLRPAGSREIRQATSAFNDMQERLQRMISQRTQMLAAVSHDLRTPLTRLLLQLAMLPQNTASLGMQDDLKTMQSMIDGYLAFAKDAGAEENAVRCNLADLLDDAAQSAKILGLKLHWQKPSAPIYVVVRAAALMRVWHNLLNNAQQYATEAWLDCTTDGQYVRVLLDDNGPGIPQNKREEVFRPFVRLDAARNLNSGEGNVGLGLAIARDVVLRHGGRISLDQSPQSGLRVVVALPL